MLADTTLRNARTRIEGRIARVYEKRISVT